MMVPNTLAEVETFAVDHPTPHQGGTWNQLCEQFINNAGNFSQAFTSALLAGNASGKLDPNPATAQPGEIHYWSGAGDGHDAFHTAKGLLCASNAIPGYVGYISFAAFAKAKPAFKYRGHTYRHGTQTLTLSEFSEVGTAVSVHKKGPTMQVVNQDSNTPWVITEHGAWPITPQLATIYEAVSQSPALPGNLTNLQLVQKDLAAHAPTSSGTAAAIDYAALAKAVNDDAAKRLAT